MTSLRLYLFGAPRLERDGDPVSLTRRKVMALLAYLAASGQPQSRDALATMLWPENDQSTARGNLRRELSRLRRSLGAELLLSTREQVWLDPGADLWLDVDQFRVAVERTRGHDHAHPESCAVCAETLAEAAALYRGDFMSGFSLPDSPAFDEWQFFESESLRQSLGRALPQLMRWHVGRGEFDRAIEYGRRWLALDPLHEPAHRMLMRLYAWADQQPAALRQYQECARLLKEELGIEPEPETRALYETIRTRQLTPPDEERKDTSPPAPLAELAPEERFVRGELLATGGHGEIYRGRDRLTGQAVIIKRLRPELVTSDPNLVARFVQEGEALCRLDHPNIVDMLAAFEHEGRHNIVMEYAAGGTLRQLLDAEAQMPLEQAVDIALELADALARAHHLNIIHRDVKPENVLLAADGTPRLTDFGVARLAREDLRLTQPGTFLGSPLYMSPETLRGEEQDARSDIWSFGVLLYEMLTGRCPFEGEQLTTVLVNILNDPVTSVSRFRPDVPPELDELLQSMLMKERNARIPSMRQVAAVLEAIRSGRPVPAGGLAEKSRVPVAKPAAQIDRAAVPPFEPRPMAIPAPQIKAMPDEDDAPLFVARKGELARLDAFLDAALTGGARLAFVTGEAGQGKTALLQAFVRRAQEAHPNLLAAGGNCNAYTGAGDPYLPFREILELLTGDVEARAVAGTLHPAHAGRLWQNLPLTIQALVKRGPDLLDTFIQADGLLERAKSHSPEGADWLAELQELVTGRKARLDSGEAQQSNLFEQYAHVVQALAQRGPLLLFLDDLQWIDLGSANLLLHLGKRLAGYPVFILGAYRPAEVAMGRGGERHPLEQAVHEFQLDFGDITLDLGQSKGRAFVDALLDSEPHSLSATFKETLYHQTGGHPLFTLELLRSMQERGDLVRDEVGRWVEGPTLNWGALPARVEGAIGERIARLAEPVRELLRVASVEGEEFTLQVIAHVLGLDERELVRLISRDLEKTHRLVQALGLKREGSLRLSRYRFRHILIQRFLYNSLDAVERAYFNESVGATLEELYSENSDPVAVQLARHFREAGQLEKAVAYLRQAGMRARRLSANEEAIAHFKEALALVKTLPETAERFEGELEVRMALGPALMVIKGHSALEVEENYARAYELCQKVEDSSQFFPALWGLWRVHLNRGNLVTALEVGEKLLDLAQAQGETEQLVEAYIALGTTEVYLGQFEDAREHFERGRMIYDPDRHRLLPFLYGGFDPEVYFLSYAPILLWLRGYADQALEASRAVLERARELAQPYSLAFSLAWVTMFHQLRLDGAQLQLAAEEAIALCREQGISTFLGMTTILQGWASVWQGREEGVDQLRQGLAVYKGTEAGVLVPYFRILLADAYGQLGRFEEGLSELSEAMALAERIGERFWEAEGYRLKGELRLRGEAAGQPQGEDISPEDCFLKAIEVARGQSAKSLELRAAVSLGRLWRDQGNRARARQVVSESYGWFTEGFETADLRKARLLLRELEEE